MIISSSVLFEKWKEQQNAVEQMIPLIGALYRDHGVTISFFGRRLLNNSAIDIIKAHRYAVQMIGEELEVSKSLKLIEAMTLLNLAPVQIDLGKFCYRYMQEGGDPMSFLKEPLASACTGKSSILKEPQDIVL